MPNRLAAGYFSAGQVYAAPTTPYQPHWERTIVEQNPEETPLLSSLIGYFHTGQAGADELYWMEHADLLMNDTTNDAALAATTAATWMTVDNVERWRVNMLALNTATGEQCVVTEVDEANNRVYLGERSFGDVAAAGIADNTQWTLLQVSREELSSAIPAMSDQPTVGYNYVQFMSDTMEMSWMGLGRSKKTIMVDQDPYDYTMERKMRDFKRRTEMTLWMGERARTTTGTTPLFTNRRQALGGIDYFCRSSPTSRNWGGAIPSFSQFADTLAYYANYNPSVKKAGIFARPEIMKEFQMMAFEKWDIKSQDALPNKLKVSFESFKIMGCEFQLYTAHMLGENYCDAPHAYILDMSERKGKIGIRYHQVGGGTEVSDGKINVLKDQQEPSYSAKKEQIVAGMGLVVPGHTLGRHARISYIGHS